MNCTTREQIADIVRSELLKALENKVIREAVKNIFCEMIEEGSLCLNLPEALSVDCQEKKIILTLSTGKELQADLNCLQP